MPYIQGAGIRRARRELCVTYPNWPGSRERIEIGFFDSERPMVALTRKEAKRLIPVLQEMSKDPLPEEERKRLVAEIEAMTPIEICEKLRANGIEPGAFFAGYPKAKAITFQGLWLDDSVIYDRHTRTISEYLGI